MDPVFPCQLSLESPWGGTPQSEFSNPALRGEKGPNLVGVWHNQTFYLGQYEGKEAHWWKYFCEHARYIVEFAANTGGYSIVGARVP